MLQETQASNQKGPRINLTSSSTFFDFLILNQSHFDLMVNFHMNYNPEL